MQKGLTRFQVLFMVVTCAFVVGNLYYNQPLLGLLSREFGLPEKTVSLVAALTLIGYALGILFLVPLGDMLERKRLLQTGMGIAGILALAISFCDNFVLLCGLSFALGFFNISATILIPFSANLAKSEERGRVVGTVLSGILIGSLLARTLAGFMADHFGWRSVFVLAGGINIFLAVASTWALPASASSFKGSYGDLLKSSWQLIHTLPTLREATLMGALLFGSFSAFWTTLTFLLEDKPFSYSPQVIGLFGVLGVMGALAAPLAGKYADKKGTAATIRFGLYGAMLAFVVLALSSTWLIGLVLGVLILDLGIQVAHISNQARIFELSEEARSRLSSLYIFAYFVGGALGSYLSSQLWAWGRWTAVCSGGLTACLLAAFFFRQGERRRDNIASH